MASCLPVCQEEVVDQPCLSCRHIVVKHNVHSYCKDCLQEWWTEKPADECPVCKTRSAFFRPANGLGLKKLCEKLSQEKRLSVSSARSSMQAVCAERREKCPSDVCLTLCHESERHAGHSFGPADEARPNCTQDIQESSLKPFKEKLGVFEEVKMNYVQTENRIEVQTRNTEAQIRKQFQNLRQFLHDEEEARVASLRQEEARKSREIKEKIESLSREMETLSNAIRDAEERRPRAGDHHASSLRSYEEAAAERVQLALQRDEPQPSVHATLLTAAETKHLLIDETKHLSDLAFRVWEKMREMVTSSSAPVILEDPEDTTTAQPGLVLLSDDLQTVMTRAAEPPEQRRIPGNVERLESSSRSAGTVPQSSENHERCHMGRSPGTTLGTLVVPKVAFQGVPS